MGFKLAGEKGWSCHSCVPWLCLLASSGKQKNPKQTVYLVLLRKELKVTQKNPSAQHGIGSCFVPTSTALCNAHPISKRYSESSKCREKDAQRYGTVYKMLGKRQWKSKEMIKIKNVVEKVNREWKNARGEGGFHHPRNRRHNQTWTGDKLQQQKCIFFFSGESHANRIYKSRNINGLKGGLGISKQSSSTLLLQPIVLVSQRNKIPLGAGCLRCK